MDVLNDRPSSKEAAGPKWDPFQFVTFAFFSAVGMATFFLAPLPSLLAQTKLPDPFPKVAALLGAVIAVIGLEAPAPWVTIAFAVSLVFSDSVVKKSLWLALSFASAAALTVGGLNLWIGARGTNPFQHWANLAATVIAELQKAVEGTPTGMNWAEFQSILTFEAPFLLVGICILACWVSLGLAVHFKWVNAEPLTAEGLRTRIRLPRTFVVVAALLFAVSALLPVPFYVSGTARVLGCVLFIQGCVCLSDVLQRRAVAAPTRTVLFSFLVVFGFYALVAIGVISPWYFRAKELMEKKR